MGKVNSQTHIPVLFHITRISSTFSRKRNETKMQTFLDYSCCLYFAAFASFWLTRIQYLDVKVLFLLMLLESAVNTYNIEQDLLPAERNGIVELRVMSKLTISVLSRPPHSWGLVKGIQLHNREEVELFVEFFTVLEWRRKRRFISRTYSFIEGREREIVGSARMCV
jgi:hypothetical protein